MIKNDFQRPPRSSARSHKFRLEDGRHLELRDSGLIRYHTRSKAMPVVQIDFKKLLGFNLSAEPAKMGAWRLELIIDTAVKVRWYSILVINGEKADLNPILEFIQALRNYSLSNGKALQETNFAMIRRDKIRSRLWR